MECDHCRYTDYDPDELISEDIIPLKRKFFSFAGEMTRGAGVEKEIMYLYGCPKCYKTFMDVTPPD